MIRVRIFLVALMLCFAMPAAVLAANCGPLGDVYEQLKSKHSETTLWVGLMAGGRQVVVLANPDGTTFTVLSVNKAKIGCLVAAGDAWAAIPPPTPTPGTLH